MRRVALILACLGPAIAQAGWGPTWTNGSIWAHQRVARDLRAAVDERCQWAGGTNTTITAPTIWMSWYWVGRVDAAIAGLAPYFCNQTLTNSFGNFGSRSNEVPPFLTFTGALHQAGITNAAGWPVFRRDATNATIWPRLADLRQRRDVLSRLRWTRLVQIPDSGRSPSDGLRWTGATSAPPSVSWADLYRSASNNFAAASWTWDGYTRAQRESASVLAGGTRSVTLTTLATKYTFTVTPSWTNWNRTIDVYANVGMYEDGSRMGEEWDGEYSETEYYGADSDGTLPQWLAYTNKASGTWGEPKFGAPSFHRSIYAPSGTVWNSYWLGDTNGPMPKAAGWEPGTGGTNTVWHGYLYSGESPSPLDANVIEAYFNKYHIIKWEARYP